MTQKWRERIIPHKQTNDVNVTKRHKTLHNKAELHLKREEWRITLKQRTYQDQNSTSKPKRLTNGWRIRTAETPARTPGETPARTPAGTTARMLEETPVRKPSEIPARTLAVTPVRTPGETPARTLAEAAERVHGETSARTPGRIPGGTPARTPVEMLATNTERAEQQPSVIV